MNQTFDQAELRGLSFIPRAGLSSWSLHRARQREGQLLCPNFAEYIGIRFIPLPGEGAIRRMTPRI